MIEKRKLTRLKLLYHLRVFDRSNFKLLGHLADIHTEGMRVISEQPLKTNAVHDIRIALPETIGCTEEIHFSAQVLWCKKYVNPLFSQAGFQIQHMSAEYVQIIESLIQKYGFQKIFNNKAVQYYRGIEGYNCAQALLKFYKNRFAVTEDQIGAHAAFGGGDAEGGICGALYAVKQLANNPKIEKIIVQRFKKEVGSVCCDDILEMGRLSCAGCIYTAATILQDIIDT